MKSTRLPSESKVPTGPPTLTQFSITVRVGQDATGVRQLRARHDAVAVDAVDLRTRRPVVCVEPHDVPEWSSGSAPKGEALGEDGLMVPRPNVIAGAGGVGVVYLSARGRAVCSAAGELHGVVVARDRRPRASAEQGATRPQAVVEEEDAVQDGPIREVVQRSHLDDGPQDVRVAAGVVAFRLRSAPSAAPAKDEPKLPAARPAVVHASGARDVVKRERVAEYQEVMPGDSVGRDRRINVDEGVVFDDPVCGLTLRLDGVVPDPLENISDDFEAGVRPFAAARVRQAHIAQPDANAVVGVDHVVLGNPYIAENVLSREKRSVQRAPEVVVHYRPGHV